MLYGELTTKQLGDVIQCRGKWTERGYEWNYKDAQRVAITGLGALAMTDPKYIQLEEPLPDGKKLYRHQIDGAIRIIKSKRIILADEMGCGKSITALVAAKKLTDELDARIIVVSPVSMMAEWKSLSAMMDGDELFYSWSKLPDVSEYPRIFKYIVIADEAHYAQGGGSTIRGKRFRALTEHPGCVACIMLTGTPMKNGKPINLLPLLRACKAPVAMKSSAYHARYCDAKSTRWSRWDTSCVSNLEELKQAVAPYILRRTKAQCLDLPKMTRVMVNADVIGDDKKSYDSTIKSAGDKFKESKKGYTDAKGALTTANQAASLAKVPYVVEMIRSLIEEGHKVVVYSTFLEPVRMINKAFGSAALMLIGDTPQTERKTLMDRFQSSSEVKVFAISAAGGVGLTLTAASYVILIDRPWTPGDALQIEGRIDRIGQTQPCTSYWVRYGEIDEARDAKLAEKAENIKATLGDDVVGIMQVEQHDEIEIRNLAKRIFK